MNPKQEKFVAEYLIDKIGIQAVKRAGYKGTEHALAVQASRMLRNAEIAQAIEIGLAKQKDEITKRAEYAGLNKDVWLERLRTIAFSNIGDAFHPDVNGKLSMTIQQMKESGFTALVKKMKVLPGNKLEIDLHSVIPAMEMLGKHYGWIKDIVQHEGSIGTPGMSAQEIEQIYADPETLELAMALADKLVPPPDKVPGKGEKR